MKNYFLSILFCLTLSSSLLAYEQKTTVLMNCEDYVFTQSVIKQTQRLFRRYQPTITKETDTSVVIEAAYGKNTVIVKGFTDDKKRKIITIETSDELSRKANRWLSQIENGARRYIDKSQ